MTGKKVLIVIIGILLAVVIVVGALIHFSIINDPFVNSNTQSINRPNLIKQNLPEGLSAVQIKKNADESRAIAENETVRISDVVNASSAQKEKIRKLFADFYSDSFSVPPERAPVVCEKFEIQLKEILSKEQQTKLGLK